MENYRKVLYHAYWIVLYRQLQDAIFFTRAEVYPVNMTNSSCLKLHLSWKNFNREWFDTAVSLLMRISLRSSRKY